MSSDPILIAGPTASGKSALALRLCEIVDGVIINADALQVYNIWRVLSARPSYEEEAQAPHRLYGHVDAEAPYSVGAWLCDVEQELTRANEAGLRPIIIGGTGLYMTALTEGLVDIPPIPEDIRREGDQIRQQGARGFAHLEKDDPKIWARIDQNNPARLQRAWEVLKTTGRSLADWQDDTTTPLLPLKSTVPLCLDIDRDWLNERIAKRFDLMVDGGALDECREWIARDLPMTLPSAKALGAAELIAFLNGEMTIDAAREAASIATRQFAKRQRTWFRSRLGDWTKRQITPETDTARIADQIVSST